MKQRKVQNLFFAQLLGAVVGGVAGTFLYFVAADGRSSTIILMAVVGQMLAGILALRRTGGWRLVAIGILATLAMAILTLSLLSNFEFGNALFCLETSVLLAPAICESSQLKG